MMGLYFELLPSPSKSFIISSLQQIQVVLTLSSNNKTKVVLAISLGRYVTSLFRVEHGVKTAGLDHPGTCTRSLSLGQPQCNCWTDP